MIFPLSKKVRREVCVHEAAHAIIGCLGGAFIYRLEVAPEGSTEWTCESRKGNAMSDLWGLCETSDIGEFSFLKWDDLEWCYTVNKAHLLAIESLSKGFRHSVRQSARAHICCLLAGPAASQIWEGEEVSLWEGLSAQHDDITKAQGLAQLLHWRNEYEYLAGLTEKTLRTPEVWTMVLRVADELERQGRIEEFDGFLPGPLQNWPPSPMSRAGQMRQVDKLLHK